MDERITQLQHKKENQTFDRKSARIDAKTLAHHVIAFANADGGTIAIGIEDDGAISGIDAYKGHVNDYYRVPFDYCVPAVSASLEVLDCTNREGKPDHVLLLHVAPSNDLHANKSDEVFYRMGDQTHKLNFEERMQMMYAKGSQYFEDTPVFRSSMDDIDLTFVAEYCRKIGYPRSAEEYLHRNQRYIIRHDGREEMSTAAILLFGKEPQAFFPRARVRFTRYEGTEALPGTEMNVVKDIVFGGRILDMVQQSIAFVQTQIKEHTFLGREGRFVTIPEYPEFCWKELIVNAVVHRDYLIKGTDIQIKMFDDHFTVESPGILAGFVRIAKLRSLHFSRNPKLAAFLHEYDFVQKFGEGIDRIYREMAEARLPDPEFRSQDMMFYATLRNTPQNGTEQMKDTQNVRAEGDVPQNVPQNVLQNVPQSMNDRIRSCILQNPEITRAEIARQLGITTKTVGRYLRTMSDIHYIGSAKTGHWEIKK